MISDKLQKIFEDDDLGLLNVPHHEQRSTPTDRLEASFMEINAFFDENQRAPRTDTTNMAERRLGVRLLAVRADDSKSENLLHLDTHGLLEPEEAPESIDEIMSGDDLEILEDKTGITKMTHVLTPVKTADHIARQRKCKDFDQFEPLFKEVHAKLKNGELHMKQFMTEQQIAKKEFFVLRGQLVYVAERGAEYRKHGKRDARLRVIYENGTESDLLSRALARGLYRGGSRIVGDVDMFADPGEIPGTEDKPTGHIYVLSSLSDDPKVANIANLHKIGFSTTSVEQRIKNASNEPTYLMAHVKIEATYPTYNMNTQKFEAIMHRVFGEARLDLAITDKAGGSREPSEWFAAPLDVIDQAVRMIIGGDIVHYVYDTSSRELVENDQE
jgi:hypothetical protein